MKTRRLVILGSTGSIGRSTLDVLRRHPGRFRVVALAAHSDAESLLAQYREFRPSYLGLADASRAVWLKEQVQGEKVEVVAGEDEIVALAALDRVDTVVNAIVGAAGLKASLETVKRGRNLALANKESLVAGGPLFPDILKRRGGTILPIDSEHSALWQALRAGARDEVRRLIITASGGPFRELPMDRFTDITPQQALEHPTWTMGPKITIDSATLTNKGLEVIEAVVLFGLPASKVSVVVHPQSIIHSMVEYVDSSIIAQLSEPDMRLPITYALMWPERPESPFGRLSFDTLRQLTFEPPDLKKFPSLDLAFQVAEKGGTAPAVFNAANEVAVAAFLNRAVRFTGIADIQKYCVDTIEVVSRPELDDILRADREARTLAEQKIGTLACC